MPEKPRAKKKTVKPTARASAPAKKTSKRAAQPAAIYLESPQLTVLLSQEKAKVKSTARQFAAFDEAKAAAIEALVDAIESAEEQLTRLKRATSLDQLNARRQR